MLLYNNEYGIDYKEFRVYFNQIEKIIFAKKGYDFDKEVSISFVSDKSIHQINKQYRSIDKSTDVITFAFNDKVNGEVFIETQMLGDIIISIDRAKKQAIMYNHSFKRELIFLFLHGFLHLVGYDHMNIDDEIEMNKIQNKIMDEIGVLR